MLGVVKIKYMYIKFGIDKTHEVQKLLNLKCKQGEIMFLVLKKKPSADDGYF